MKQKHPKYNSIKHGILSKSVVLKEGESRIFNKIAKQLIRDLNPQNTLEIVLAEQVVVQYWRLKRFLNFENDLVQFAGKPHHSFEKDMEFVEIFSDYIERHASLELISRYNATVLKSFYRSINEYKALKSK
jgi:hypothetical protein